MSAARRVAEALFSALEYVVTAALYPVCLWYARLKARRRDWWLGYL